MQTRPSNARLCSAVQTCGSPTELGLAGDAVKVLRQVQKEKDSLAELWYLMAFAYRMMGKEAAVHEAALRGLQHLRKVGGAEQRGVDRRLDD